LLGKQHQQLGVWILIARGITLSRGEQMPIMLDVALWM